MRLNRIKSGPCASRFLGKSLLYRVTWTNLVSLGQLTKIRCEVFTLNSQSESQSSLLGLVILLALETWEGSANYVPEAVSGLWMKDFFKKHFSVFEKKIKWRKIFSCENYDIQISVSLNIWMTQGLFVWMWLLSRCSSSWVAVTGWYSGQYLKYWLPFSFQKTFADLYPRRLDGEVLGL